MDLDRVVVEEKAASHEVPTNPQDIAYPEELKRKEYSILSKRHAEGAAEARVGFALSGGGIRSATFCLGVFQGLARKAGLLRKIDYLSSVSGGGFFAAFYGRLFSRADVENNPIHGNRLNDIERLLSPDAKTRLSFEDEITTERKQVRSWKTAVFPWLRENGRYLAPNGNGDLLLGAAVFLRNWATIQLFLSSSLLAFFLLTGLVRCALPEIPTASDSWLWPSPYLYVVAAMALFVVVPLGWSYWCFTLGDPDGITGGDQFTPSQRWRAAANFGGFGTVVLAGLAVIMIAVGMLLGSRVSPQYLRCGGIAILELTFIAWQFARLYGSLPDPLRIVPAVMPQPNPETANSAKLQGLAAFITLVPDSEANLPIGQRKAIRRMFALVASASFFLAVFAAFWSWSAAVPASFPMLIGTLVFFVLLAVLFWRLTTPKSRDVLLDQSEKARNVLSQSLRTALFITLAILLFAILDSFGQTVYALSFHRVTLHVFAAIFSVVSAIVPFARWLASLIGVGKKDQPGIPLRLLAGIGAFIVFLPFLISINAISHGMAYNLAPPEEAPARLVSSTRRVETPTVLKTSDGTLELRVACPRTLADGAKHPGALRDSESVLEYLALTVFFCLLVGGFWTSGSWTFVNRSSLHPLYAARLIRAYLGASNNLRYGNKAPGISDPVDGDDITQDDYWLANDEFWNKGAPLHIVNVTINETVDGRTQTEERDRKGLGMAVGPGGISVGVKHHVVFVSDEDTSEVKIYPESNAGEFRVFAPDEGQEKDTYSGQPLSLGNWTAISGAAVATGLGSRNSLGVSLLTGFFNLRLGYWWNSGTQSITRGSSAMRWIGKWTTKLFPAQSALIDEFLGRFHGTVRQYWLLTDGGHFEDLGLYELIRRRLPLMVAIDAEADPDYDFEELANLIRKARLDFNAEVTFLDPQKDHYAFENLIGLVGDYFQEVRGGLVGSLDQLRRGTWSSEPVPERASFFKSPKPTGLSLRHAAIARVTYLDDPAHVSLLLLIKPTLIGEEPQDILKYHSANPAFPQQTTADQFFDEAQWESYRRLGQHIAERLFNIA